jgi:hypothetical protein
VNQPHEHFSRILALSFFLRRFTEQWVLGLRRGRRRYWRNYGDAPDMARLQVGGLFALNVSRRKTAGGHEREKD